MSVARRPRSLPANPDAPDHAMPIMAHLLELRTRIIRAALGILLTTSISFFFAQNLMDIFLALRPTTVKVDIQVVEIGERFATYFKVSLTAGLILAMPLIIYELFRFLSPGLRASERRWLLMSLPGIIFFFVSGVVFGYLA